MSPGFIIFSLSPAFRGICVQMSILLHFHLNFATSLPTYYCPDLHLSASLIVPSCFKTRPKVSFLTSHLLSRLLTTPWLLLSSQSSFSCTDNLLCYFPTTPAGLSALNTQYGCCSPLGCCLMFCCGFTLITFPLQVGYRHSSAESSFSREAQSA